MCKLDILKAYGLQVSKHVFVNVAHLTGRNVCTNGNEYTRRVCAAMSCEITSKNPLS